jgi:phosphohistidine phosphatase SixA
MIKRRYFLVSVLGLFLAYLQPLAVLAEDNGPFATNNYELTASEKLDMEWAQRLRSGGYILHFRHAQREQWNDVFAFDAYELLAGLDASKSSFSRATCLTDQGKEEAKLLGRALKVAFVSIQEVISSPSCRARQTSLLAFKKINRIENSLLHRSAIPKVQHLHFDEALRRFLMGLSPRPGKNIALVGHVDTLEFSTNSVLDKEEGVKILVDSRDPTGFVILEKVVAKIYARHVFRSLKDFTLATMLVPLTSSKG